MEGSSTSWFGKKIRYMLQQPGWIFSSSTFDPCLLIASKNKEAAATEAHSKQPALASFESLALVSSWL